MDFDIIFNAPRWKILEYIASRPSSPLEISKALQTSPAYISQQLKLLETAGVVSKEKTKNSKAGKPRTVFTISQEIAYLAILTRQSAIKKPIYLTNKQKVILRIWCLETSSLHPILEKFFQLIENELEEITAIFISFQAIKNKLIIVSDSKKVSLKAATFFKEIKSSIETVLVSKDSFEKLAQSEKSLCVLHDPLNLLAATQSKLEAIKDA